MKLCQSIEVEVAVAAVTEKEEMWRFFFLLIEIEAHLIETWQLKWEVRAVCTTYYPVSNTVFRGGEDEKG